MTKSSSFIRGLVALFCMAEILPIQRKTRINQPYPVYIIDPTIKYMTSDQYKRKARVKIFVEKVELLAYSPHNTLQFIKQQR